MDTGIDFLTPEFLNLIFFEQKNLVIYPYVDLKHLKALEIFSVGHNILDLESTALYNLKEIIELETENYSQTPNLYIIYNLTREKAKDLLDLKGARCILNVSEDARNLANGELFIFYNKKSRQFINYEFTDKSLKFEEYLISNSENETILLDNIQKIKSTASKIFMHLNKTGDLANPESYMGEYKKRFWPKILRFVENYYQVKIPEVKSEKTSFEVKTVKSKDLSTISDEYDTILTNNIIGKEFIQLLHKYVNENVNTNNLEAKDLYNPRKLYIYLRNHHWDEEIPEDFLFNWIKMEHTNYALQSQDLDDFESIFECLGISSHLLNNILDTNLEDSGVEAIERSASLQSEEVSSVKITDFPQFKQQILSLLDKIEKKLGID